MAMLWRCASVGQIGENIVKNFNDTEKKEIVECFEVYSKKHGTEAVAVETKGNLKGFLLKINDCPAYLIALDPAYFDFNYSITLSETNTLKEQKAAIEKAIFELTAYDYLATLLEEENVSYTLNCNEYGYVVSCEISPSHSDIMYEILLDFCSYKGSVSVDDEEDYVRYTFSSGNMNTMKNMIDAIVDDLI